jgi:hypothetical protein
LLKTKAVVAPEVPDSWGQIINLEKNPTRDHWSVELDLKMGNTMKSTVSSGALGILYLKNVAPESS